ncbi:MAG TPA: hypothetical protein VFA21_07500 [Pyrinomonadaceae bacterium]|nr:hypothetical protein [Pyrinomonadaceae bacterium]
MKQVIEGFSNEETLRFTNELADLLLARQGASGAKRRGLSQDYFSGSDLKITDANRAEVIREAEASARAYAQSRNKQGTTPKAHGAGEARVVEGVKAWLERRRVRGHGRRVK